jgi:hypothetical protein
MSDVFFGDFDVEDAYDTVPADPEQVARKIHGYRQLLERLIGADLPAFDDLTAAQRAALMTVGFVIVKWVADNDPDDEAFARMIHETQPGGVWSDLPDDHKRLAIMFAALLSGWLLRQGAWR